MNKKETKKVQILFSEYKKNKKANKFLLSIHNSFRNLKKKTIHLLGCSQGFFKKWITFQFTENMTIDNDGSFWNFDHFLPLSFLNLLDEEQTRIRVNWNNLCPTI